MTNHRSRLPASGRLRWRAALALAALGGAALSAAGAAGQAAASAHARSFPLLPGDLLVSRSVYTGTPGLLQPGVTVLPPGCTTGCVTANSDGSISMLTSLDGLLYRETDFTAGLLDNPSALEVLTDSAGRLEVYVSDLEGDLVVLRRHVPENVAAFQRWYSDVEVARLARYQDAPMRSDEIDRFFQLRALGHETLTMAIHERATDRLIGSCAFSQFDGDNGSAMFHITIGEKDAWGHGYGTESTRLMLDHAFGTLGLHRVALSVFEYN